MESPFVCNPNAMTAEQRRRHQGILEQLRASAQGVDELPDGYALRLPANAALTMLAAEFMTLESLCCPFLSFGLKLELPEQKLLRLELTGPEGIKQFLQAEFGFT